MKIPVIKRSQERALLMSLLGGIHTTVDNSVYSRAKRFLASFLLSMSVPVLMLFALRIGGGWGAATVVAALVMGFLIARFLYRFSAARHWAVIARSLDRCEIERRLNELDAQLPKR